MEYLTYEEYLGMGFVEMEEGEFDRLLKRASDVIDGITRSFYRFNDMEKDVSWRREQFKKAVAAQIEYFYEMGAANTHGLNEPDSVTIGRTSISKGYRDAQNRHQNGLISNDALFYLKNTGLLYAGIGAV